MNCALIFFARTELWSSGRTIPSLLSLELQMGVVWRSCPKVVEVDFHYPSEGIHRRWDSGYRITSIAASWDQAVFVLTVPQWPTIPKRPYVPLILRVHMTAPTEYILFFSSSFGI